MKDAVLWVFDALCVLTRHAGGCGVMNAHWYLFCTDDRRCLRLPNPLHRIVRWAVE